MPVQRGRDSDGPFYRWGEHGKKYRYEAGDVDARERAKKKADAQGRAVKVREHAAVNAWMAKEIEAAKVSDRARATQSKSRKGSKNA